MARREFDVSLPARHSYLEELEELRGDLPDWPEPGQEILLPLLALRDVVLVPGQALPLHSIDFRHQSLLRYAVSNRCPIAVITERLDREQRLLPISVGTLFEVRSVRDNDEAVSIYAIGRQRFTLLSVKHGFDGVDYARVKILDDVLLPDAFADLCSPALLHLPRRISYVTDRLVQWLCQWFKPDKIAAIREEGLTKFSFWVAANLPVDIESKLALLEENSVNGRLQRELALISQDCHTVFCSSAQVISLSTEGFGVPYVNSGGYVHDLLTVNEVRNAHAIGRASAEYSWFPGYKWTIHQCDGCNEHIGWKFTSSKLNPNQFWGLTRRCLVPVLVKTED